jgi:hypothetical protein
MRSLEFTTGSVGLLTAELWNSRITEAKELSREADQDSQLER